MSNDNLTVGKYKLVNCLATGQNSQVWEAIDNETTRRVAMKMLLPEALSDPEQIAALKSEFKIGSSFEHPNIVKYHELEAKGGLLGKIKQAYFTMDLFSAQNLKGWYHNDLRGIHIRFKRLVELLSVAIEHVHEKGWIHRDIKPENILMSKAAEVRLIDFSLASRPASALTKVFARKQATVKGTRTYMAPEQILGKPLTVQTDIYNLGVTLFELLTGQAPFAGSTPKEILMRHVGEKPPDPSSFNSNITPEMERILLRMLSKKPADRQKSMSEFVVEFRNVSVFKEPVLEEVALTEEQQAEKTLQSVIGSELDSRADALRTKLGIAAPASTRRKKQQAKPTAAPTPPPAPPQPQMAPGMMQPMVPQPMMPQPMMPYPMAPMPPAYGGAPGMPMAPMPGMPMPGGPSPWVSVPAASGAPWTGQPVHPSQPVAPRPGQPPVAGAPPVAPRPAPPPVAPTAVPQVSKPPVAAPPPVKPAAKPPARPPTKPEQGMKIDDLLGFDELPPVV